MYSTGAAVILSLFSIAWLLVISYFLWKEYRYLKGLFPKSGTRDIRTKFQDVLDALDEVKKRESMLNKHVKEVSIEGLSYIQKMKILRYNPYNDTGGNQSFSIALLDGKLSGFILTSLHSRSGTRVYAKPIKDGEAELELSKEEKEVLNSAGSS